MRKFIIILISIILPSYAFSQLYNVDSVLKKGVICIVLLINKEGDTTSNVGSGFIINGEYLATCYHIFSHNMDRPISIKIYYNFSRNDKKYNFDSTNISISQNNKNMKYFGKYYNKKDPTTDFIILRLNKKVAPIKYIITNNSLKIGQTLTSCGPYLSSKHFSFQASISHFIGYMSKPNIKNPIYILTITSAHEGFSGAIQYNSKGEGVSMIQRGYNTYDSLPSSLKNGIPQLKEYYKNGWRVAVGIDFKYLYHRYLSVNHSK